MKKLHLFIIVFITLFFAVPQAYCNSYPYQKGIEFYNRLNYAAAEPYFKQALSKDLSNDEIRYYLAITLVKNKKINEAKFHYNYIIKNSKNAEITYLARRGLSLIDKNYKIPAQSLFLAKNSTQKTIIKMDDSHAIKIHGIKINNLNAGSFILDTGASYTSISFKMAKKLGLNLNSAPKIKMQTANGIISVPKVILDKVEVNGLVARNVEATVSDVSKNNITGLLGLSFLNNFKITVNKANKEVILEKP